MLFVTAFQKADDGGCMSGCSAEIQATVSATDGQDSFCALTAAARSCLTCFSDELVAAHCACDTGWLFTDQFNSTALYTNVFCSGAAACEDAVVELALTLDASAGAASADVHAELAAGCAWYDCAGSCSAAVQATVGNASAFCALSDADRHCLSGACDLAAEVLAAHCSCGTALLFSLTVATYDLTSEYCGGSDGCQTSVLDLLVAMVADGEAARDGLGVKLASRCSYSGRRLSEASACYAATTTCGDAVTALAVAGNQDAFCDLDRADYACFDDCFDAGMVVAPHTFGAFF